MHYRIVKQRQWLGVYLDYLSKWPEVYALPDRKAETVARCLLDLVWRHGVPNRIIHDRAAEFLSDVLQETARLIGVKQLLTSGGHPQKLVVASQGWSSALIRH